MKELTFIQRGSDTQIHAIHCCTTEQTTEKEREKMERGGVGSNWCLDLAWYKMVVYIARLVIVSDWVQIGSLRIYNRGGRETREGVTGNSS